MAKPLSKLVIFILISGTLIYVRTPLLLWFRDNTSQSTYQIATYATKMLFWVIPTLLFLIYIDKQNVREYLGITKFKKGILLGLIIPAFQAAYYLFLHFILKKPVIMPGFMSLWELVSTIVFAAMVEEMVFRGYLLPKASEFMNFWLANCIVSLLFVLAHIPWWLRTGTTILPATLATLFVLSFAWGILRQKSGSLWSTITAHALNNIIAIALLGL